MKKSPNTNIVRQGINCNSDSIAQTLEVIKGNSEHIELKKISIARTAIDFDTGDVSFL